MKGFAAPIILIAMIAFVVVFGAVWYFNRPSNSATPQTVAQQPASVVQNTISPSSAPDETANWKTYTNTKYNYEINYPDNWKLREPKPSDYNGKGNEYKYYNLELQSPDYTSNITSPEEPYLFIENGSRILISNPVAVTLNKPLVEYVKEKNGLIDERSIRKMRINGLETVEAESSIQLGSQYQISKHFYVIHNNELYEINRQYIKGQESKYQKIFDQILSTFKFTD